MTPRTAITAALDAELPVFPAGLSKRPLVGGWNTDAPLARREWSETMSWLMLGLALPDRVVLDLDAPELPDDLSGALSGGTLVRTPRGWHWHFTLPAGLAARQRIAWKPGIDLKAGAGSYVVIPPSRGYKLLRGSLVRPPPAPSWLVEAVSAPSQGEVANPEGSLDETWRQLCRLTDDWRPRSEGASKVANSLLDEVRRAAPGTQHATLNRVAWTFGRKIGRYRFESLKAAELQLIPAACKMPASDPAWPWTWANARPIVRRALIAGFHQGQGERSPKE